MTTIGDVRESLAACVTLTGLRCDAYLSDIVSAPCAQVGRPAFDPQLVFTGAKAVRNFTIMLYFERTADVPAQRRLDSYCDATGELSVLAAVQNGANWTATVDYAQVRQVGATGVAQIADVEYLTVQFDVEVCW